MFNLFRMMDSYESRAVDRYEEGDLFVDTCQITDSDQPFETAICHPAYNDGKLIIVELYDTIEEAKSGHEKWVKIMTSKKLPTVLEDVSSADIVKLGLTLGFDIRGKYEKDFSKTP